MFLKKQKKKKKGKKTFTRATKMNAKVLHPKHETGALSLNHHTAVPYCV